MNCLMRLHFAHWTISALFMLIIAGKGYAVNDKSGERTILAAEKQKIERLIEKASSSSSRGSDSCLVYAEEAARLSQANNAPDLQAKALEIIAIYQYDREEYQISIKNLQKLLVLYTQTGDSLKKGKIYNIYGTACLNTGIYDEALNSYYHAIRLARECKDNHLMASGLHNTGVLYDEMKRPAEAMIYYNKALDLFRVLREKDGEAAAMQNVGIIYNSQKKHREALGYFLTALKTFTELNDSLSMALMYLNLGTLYEDQNDFNRSLPYYNMALEFSLKAEYKYGIAYGYFSIGSVYRKTGKYNLALDNLQKSLEYSKMISLAENERDCHSELARVFYALGDYKTAFEETQEVNTLNDSLFSDQVHQGIAEVEMRFKTEMKDQEIENLRRKSEATIQGMIRRTIGLISVVTLTLIVIAVTMYYSRTMKKANVRLQQEVDERTRAEKELISIKENLEDRVTERTKALEKAKLKAEESDRLKSAFIANMSHEIRTPLNAITGFSGLLLRDDVPADKRKEYNDHIVKNNKVLVNMIEDLIDTSKIESGNLQLHPSLINIKQFLYRLNEPVLDNLTRRNKPFIQVVIDQNKMDIDSIVADPVRLQQVIWHLLDNAGKFTRDGSIHDGGGENNDHVVFYVSDSGSG